MRQFLINPTYAVPQSLAEAIEAMAGGESVIMSGGTDVFPAHVDRPLPRQIVDVSRVPELRGVTRTEEGWRIGATTTWTDIVQAGFPPAFRALQQAAAQIGARQVQNRATIAGNICNASPAADGVPPLLALDASVELISRSGSRRLPLEQFITGYRQTARRPDEVLSAVLVPAAAAAGSSAFEKLGARKYLVISIVMAAARLVVANGRIAGARVAVGAAADRALRLTRLEQDLIGTPVDGLGARVDDAHLAVLSPIDDVRATASYRREAARHLVATVLQRAVS